MPAAKQSEKVNLLRSAVEKMSTQYGENDKRTTEWQTKLNKAETALEKTRQEMDKTTKSLDKMDGGLEDVSNKTDETNKNMTGLGDLLNQVGGKFGVSLPSEITNTINGMVNVDLKTVALVGGFAALAAAIIAFLALYETCGSSRFIFLTLLPVLLVSELILLLSHAFSVITKSRFSSPRRPDL